MFKLNSMHNLCSAWQFALEQARVLRQPTRRLNEAPPQYIIDAFAASKLFISSY